MPIHAILGATGGTGSSVLRQLLSAGDENITINILVRSRAKLLAAFPQLADAHPGRVNVFEGSISNEAILAAAIRGVSYVYVCVSTNNSARKVEIAHQTAAYLVTALGQVRKAEGSSYKPPVTLFNRSLSLSTNVRLPVPEWMKRSLLWVIGQVYEDLERAQLLYTVAEKDELLKLVIVDAPMLMDAQGTEATGYKLLQDGTSSWYLSYADFGKAMVEVGKRHEELEGQAVAVSATGKVQSTWGAELWIIILGLRYKLFPF